MVSVRWQGGWYRYLTNVVDPRRLSARQVCELYRRRWRIEDAFARTKRLLDLAYVWTGSTKGIQLQIYATLMVYAVLLMVCQQVAQALSAPLERISVEMVFRAFYHYSRAVQRGECEDLVTFLANHAKLLGLVKRQRKSHRERQELESIIWGILKLRPVCARTPTALCAFPRTSPPPRAPRAYPSAPPRPASSVGASPSGVWDRVGPWAAAPAGDTTRRPSAGAKP